MKQHLQQVLQQAKGQLQKSSTPMVQERAPAGLDRSMVPVPSEKKEDSPQSMNRSEISISELAKANGKQISQKVQQDGKSDTDPKTGFEAAKKHDYIPPDGNENSEKDFQADSMAAFNFLEHPKQFWSCFEPRMVGYGRRGIPLGAGADAESIKLTIACAANCTWPYAGGRWLTTDNYFEVIDFYLPEHQAGYNNYGINRLRAQDESNWGNNMKRSELLKVKKRYNDQEKQIVDEIDNKKAIKKSVLNLSKLDRDQPRFGQQHWGGFFPDFQEGGEIHGYRSKGSIEWADLRPKDILAGWDKTVGDTHCIFNAFPPKRKDKDTINLWTEYKQVAWYWRLPEFIMQLNDPQNDPPIPGSGSEESRTVFLARQLNQDRWSKSIQETGKENPPFWKNTGAAAFRMAKWPQSYGDLKDVGIQEQDDEKLVETVLFGGYERYPFAPNFTTFGPPLSNAAIAAERGFDLFSLPSFFKKINVQDKYRMVRWTKDWKNKEGDIDKLQRVFPPDDSGDPSECFRAQRIPNNIESTEDNWVKTNFPPDLVDYYNSGNPKQRGEINHMMWNYTHTVCTCKERGNFAGCQGQSLPDMRLPQQERKDRYRGDWRYAVFEVPRCEWGQGPLGFPSAFVNVENLLMCNLGPNATRNKYQGLKDRYGELPK